MSKKAFGVYHLAIGITSMFKNKHRPALNSYLTLYSIAKGTSLIIYMVMSGSNNINLQSTKLREKSINLCQHWIREDPHLMACARVDRARGIGMRHRATLPTEPAGNIRVQCTIQRKYLNYIITMLRNA